MKLVFDHIVYVGTPDQIKESLADWAAEMRGLFISRKTINSLSVKGMVKHIQEKAPLCQSRSVDNTLSSVMHSAFPTLFPHT